MQQSERHSPPKENWQTWVDTYYEVFLSRATALFHGRNAEAADFLHDLLIEMKRRWETLEQPQAWLSTTMRYRIADYFAETPCSPTQEQEHGALEQTREAIDPSLQLDLETAIARLPKKQMHILTLFLEGHSVESVAEQLQISADNTYQRLSRARKNLKRLLGESHV